MAISLICYFNFQSTEKYNCQYVKFSALKQAPKYMEKKMLGELDGIGMGMYYTYNYERR
jgi:hypothetical protein